MIKAPGMPWYIYIALRHLFPQGKRFPVFTFMSIAGVALGVAVLIVVNSVFVPCGSIVFLGALRGAWIWI